MTSYAVPVPTQKSRKCTHTTTSTKSTEVHSHQTARCFQLSGWKHVFEATDNTAIALRKTLVGLPGNVNSNASLDSHFSALEMIDAVLSLLITATYRMERVLARLAIFPWFYQNKFNTMWQYINLTPAKLA